MRINKRALKVSKENLKFLLKQKVFVGTIIVNIFTISLGLYLTNKYFFSLTAEIPLFYSMPWGSFQLAPNVLILLPLLIATTIFFVNTIFSARLLINSGLKIANLLLISGTIINIMLIIYTVRILSIGSRVLVYLPEWISLIGVPLLAAFIVTLIIIPFVIKMAKKYGFMDDPLTHKHPAMLLSKPVPRAGGLAFYLGVLIPSFLFLPMLESQKLLGIFIGALICVIVGLKDDKSDMSPYTRLFFQFVAVFITVMSGFILIYIPNPFGAAIKLDDFKFAVDFLGEYRQIHYLSAIAAGIWMLLMMNFMSWANGTDGVYAGLITITSTVISIIILTTAYPLDPLMDKYITLSALIAGAGLAMAIFTWPPNKILWGFGATAPALMIAAISIIGSTKVAVTFLVLMIPFIDGLFAIIRRISRKQLPFWGDREHFHHKLLDGFGWSKQKIAIFYWTTTVILGIIAIATSGVTRALTVGMIAAFFFAIIAALNFIKKPGYKSS